MKNMIINISLVLLFLHTCGAICVPEECEIGGIGYCGKFPWQTKEGCYCSPGWLHFKGDPVLHCIPMRDENPRLWDGIAYFITVVEAIIAVVCISLLIFYGKSHQNVRLHRFIRLALVITAVTALLGIILWGVDPFGQYHRLSFFQYNIISNLSLDTIVLNLGAILFSWIEVHEFTIEKFHNEVMLKKINSNYVPREYTVNDVMNVINLARHRFAVFVILVIVALLFSVAEIVSGYIRSFALSTLTFTLWGLYIVSVSIAFCILMGRYSRRISRLMPEEIAPRVKKATNRFIVVACINVTGIIVGCVTILLFTDDASAFVIGELITFLMLITQPIMVVWFAVKSSPRINSWKSTKKTQSGSAHSLEMKEKSLM